MNEKTLSNLTVRYLNENEYTDWDSFLGKAAGGNVYSSSTWLKAVEIAFLRKTRIVGVFREEKLVGGIGLSLRSIPGVGYCATPPPATAYNSIVSLLRSTDNLRRQETNWFAIADALCEFLEKEYQVIDLVNHSGIFDIRPFQWRDWESKIYYTYHLDIRNPKALWETLYHDVRTRVRKCESEGISVSRGNGVEGFYHLWKGTFGRQGRIPPVTEKSLGNLFTELKKSGRFILYEARNSKEILAAIAIMLEGNGNAHIWQAANAPESLTIGVPHFLMWYAIEDLSKQEIVNLDFDGGGMKGIALSNDQFGGTLVPYYRVWKTGRLWNNLRGVWNLSKRFGIESHVRRIFRF